MARSAQYPPSVRPGIPKLPPLPDGWIAVPFGAVLEKVKRPASLEDDVEYQLVNAKRSRGGIVARARLRGRDVRVKTQFYTRAGDFLISRRQIIHGACGVVPSELDGAVVSNEYDTMVVKGNRLLLAYLQAFSHTTYFQRTCFQSSIGVDVEKMVFKRDRWQRHKMPLPPLSEQKKIAAILSSADEAVEATHRVIEQIRRVKEGLLQDLLTRGIQHTRFKQTEIGDIPEGWEVKRTCDVAEVIAGGTPSRSEEGLYGEGIPWVKSGEVGKYRVRSTEESITPLGLTRSAAKLISPGSTLIAMYGATAGVVGQLQVEAATNQAVAALIPSQEISSSFLFYAAQAGSNRLMKYVQGSGQPNLNGKMIKNMKLPLPPMVEQERIAAALNSVDEQIATATKSVRSLEVVKSGLLQDLLTGKTRVQP